MVDSAQNSDYWSAIMNTVLDLRIPEVYNPTGIHSNILYNVSMDKNLMFRKIWCSTSATRARRGRGDAVGKYLRDACFLSSEKAVSIQKAGGGTLFIEQVFSRP